ncbi:MAG: hypothetical protein J5641_03300 [Bacteroidales bacterium]|nr:hypothetical protein [Bacteroidales bacterium]
MLKNWIKNGFARWQVCRGKAVDIWSTGRYPANVLSNLCDNEFVFDGVRCGSMEGFLQSLKTEDEDYQLQICRMGGRVAKKEAEDVRLFSWRERQTLYWKGKAMQRQSEEFAQLVREAYRAMFEQNQRFRDALLATKGKRLYHRRGGDAPAKTILTEKEFCEILTELREGRTVKC